MAIVSLLQTLRHFDNERPAIPAEHWMAFGAGLALLLSARRRSWIGRVLSATAGAALVLRSLSGRDGAVQMLRKEYRDSADRELTLVEGQVIASTARQGELPTGETRSADHGAKPQGATIVH